MARFQGNVHAGSDRAAATVLFVVLVLLVLAVAWAWLDPQSFGQTMNSIGDMFNVNR